MIETMNKKKIPTSRPPSLLPCISSQLPELVIGRVALSWSYFFDSALFCINNSSPSSLLDFQVLLSLLQHSRRTLKRWAPANVSWEEGHKPHKVKWSELWPAHLPPWNFFPPEPGLRSLRRGASAGSAPLSCRPPWKDFESQNPNHHSIISYLEFDQDRTKARRTHNQAETKTTLRQVNDLDWKGHLVEVGGDQSVKWMSNDEELGRVLQGATSVALLGWHGVLPAMQWLC